MYFHPFLFLSELHIQRVWAACVETKMKQQQKNKDFFMQLEYAKMH